MRSPMKLLSLTVRATVVLLTAGAFLVVLGIFDDLLDWDIFSPEVETLLRGVFAACVSLGGFGAAICVVLGIQEVVRAFRKLVARDDPAEVREAPRRTYTVALAAVLLLLVVTVAGLGAVNRRVEAHRLKVFKLIVRDQMAQLGPHLAAEVARVPAPCSTCATPAMEQFFVTLLGLSFCQSATLYLPDPADPANETVLWRYPKGDPRYSDEPPRIERFFIAKDDDRAIQLALKGDTAWIDQKNAGPGFVWHHVVKDGQGKARAVLQIWGNQNESFREYQAVAEAAEKTGKKAGS